MRRRQPHRPPCRSWHRGVVSTRDGGRWGGGMPGDVSPKIHGKSAAVPIAGHTPAVDRGCATSRRGQRRACSTRAARRPDARPPLAVIVVPQAALPWQVARPCGNRTCARPAARVARGSADGRRAVAPVPARTPPWRPRPPAVRTASGRLGAPALAWARAERAPRARAQPRARGAAEPGPATGFGLSTRVTRATAGSPLSGLRMRHACAHAHRRAAEPRRDRSVQRQHTRGGRHLSYERTIARNETGVCK